MFRFKLLLGFIFSANFGLLGQTQDDQLIKVISDLETRKIYELPKSERVIKIGEYFLGLPYAAGTLEGEQETLKFHFDKFDCVTYVETVISLVDLKTGEKSNAEKFKSTLTKLRYNAQVVSYPTRRHYFSEWMKSAEKNFILELQQPEGIAVKSNKMINFMSTHPKSYSRLSESEIFTQIEEYEQLISLEGFYYLPKEKYADWKKYLKAGDVIAFVTSIPGLDVSHVGFVYEKDGKFYLLNAPKPGSPVKINETTIEDNLNANKNYIGVMLGRIRS